MSTGRAAPFAVGDRVTAITKDGGTTKVRGTVAKAIEPLPADIFGEATSVWEFEVEWDDRSRNLLICPKCSRSILTATAAANDDSGYFGIRRGQAQECCGERMAFQPARDSRVSEYEIKGLSAVDLIAGLDTGEPPA